MRSTRKLSWALFTAMLFLILNAGDALAIVDDYTPEVTTRVARISFISGDVQIKRADQTEWERATNNLPIVEGDEIATDENSRLEIQFNSESYLRLSENAYLKITTLRDEGIAVSLPNGSLSVRVLAFDKDRASFEIDAPQTTVSVERAGMYRVDAGSSTDTQVRVAVTESGQARVYSENSGFTLKNGRSATVQIDGNYAGEWETADASRYADEFDSWVLQRDAVVAKRLQRADYDKYYDRDIYGAEDLNEYGEWVFTRKYGYVWKPYRTSVSSYADWSPYRYGQWRWVAPYGWTWVNDESWGWATYHHGRWVWDSGYWYWSPYSQYRSRRSWWRPALVVLSYYGSSVCWYPLPYHYGYYDYNRSTYIDRRRYTTIINNTTTVIVNPTPTPLPNQPTPLPTPTGGIIRDGWVRDIPAPIGIVPPGGVIVAEVKDFGTGKGKFNVAPGNLANQVLSKTPSETTKPPVLPTRKELSGKVSREIIAETPVKVKNPAQVKIGATERTSGVALGETLRKERIQGNRPPVEQPDRPTTTKSGLETTPPVRTTGAVKRENAPVNNQAPVKQTPRDEGMTNNNPVRSTGGKPREENPPAIVKPRNDNRENVPTYVPPRREERQEPVRPQPPPRREREEPVRVQPPPRNEPPPPRREEPRPQQPKSEPAPRKPEPAPEKKPAPVSVEGKGKG